MLKLKQNVFFNLVKVMRSVMLWAESSFPFLDPERRSDLKVKEILIAIVVLDCTLWLTSTTT